MDIQYLSTADVVFTAILVVFMAGITWLMQLGVGKNLLIGLVRLCIQLTLLGYILDWVFALDALWAVLGIIIVMTLIAGYEISARQTTRKDQLYTILTGLGAMSVGAWLTGAILLLFILKLEPVWSPQYAIPLIGMLLGNTMNGVALAIDRLKSNIKDNHLRIEAQLAHGLTANVILRPYTQQAFKTALIPTINGMMVAGIVSIPGMMTGQVLAGADPSLAAKYQIIIFCGIALCSGMGSLVAIGLTKRRLFDQRQRLLPQ